jgi:hypothetical protein
MGDRDSDCAIHTLNLKPRFQAEPGNAFYSCSASSWDRRQSLLKFIPRLCLGTRINPGACTIKKLLVKVVRC